jgi:hypothetical protein
MDKKAIIDTDFDGYLCSTICKLNSNTAAAETMHKW